MRIEEYALIGDGHTAALVGRNGSIDWMCLPTFASAACFASLLGDEENGFWRLAPTGKVREVTRRYMPHTLVLETTIETTRGTVQLIDFMPPRKTHSHVIRLVRGVRGKVEMHGELAVRFSYGEAVPWVTRLPGGVRAVAGPDSLELQTPVKLEGKDLRTVCTFTVRAGETVPFVLTYGSYGDYSETAIEAPVDVDKSLAETQQFWTDWAMQCTYQGPYREMVERSLITLKALAFDPTGGIVAAPTTSLPEDIGGVRNWDYRYCWLRDATFTLLALMNGGYNEEARAWMNWMHRTIAGKADQLQIMYGIAGERALAEWTVPWLPGYEKSAPVRIGNAASEQLQLDTYGEVLDAFFWAYHSLDSEKRTADFALLRRMVTHLEAVWQQRDKGIWEVRDGAQHFTYSKVMAWVAFDRAVKIAELAKLDAPVKRWKKTRDAIHKQVCAKAFNKRLNSFVQHYDSKNLDASVLLLAIVGFLPPDDPRILGTVQAIEKHLTRDGLVMRYDPRKVKDGLPGQEGVFLACSFWMVSNLKLIGREADARKLFERLLTLANDTGLLSEEYDTRRRRQVGNFPQAFSHISLVTAAYHLDGDGLQRHTAAAHR